MKLTKRELVMLIMLIIIAVLFIEYRFVLVPGLAHYDSLIAKENVLRGQVDTIKLNLAIAKQNEKKRDDSIAEIEQLAKRYFDQLQMDALLVRTHDILLQTELTPEQYQIYEIQTVALTPQTYGSFDLSYEMKNLAELFWALSNPTQPAPGGTTNPSLNDQIEQYQIVFSATATYNQLKAFLDEINNLERSVIVTAIAISPGETLPEPTETGETTVPTEPEDPTDRQMLNINITLQYFGLVKLIPAEEDFNRWYREPFAAEQNSPFYRPEPTPVPTEPTEQ